MEDVTAAGGCRYRIDPQDAIVSVDDGWKTFARENDGESLAAERILETSLWRHITGLETRFLYKLVIDCVRKTGNRLVFPVRCDAPTCRRWLMMRIDPEMDGSCEFTTVVTRHVERPYLALFDARHPRTEESLPRCSWCMQLETGPSRWEEAEKAEKRLALHAGAPLPRLVHTVCPECVGRIESICMTG